MTKSRTIYSKETKARLVAEYAKSGLGPTQFAARMGINLGTLNNWIYRSAGETNDKVRLVEVCTESERTTETIDICVNEQIMVSLPISIDPKYLGQLVRELANSAC